ESAYSSNDIEPRPHGSLGIVFVRDWITEISQYPVAPELGQEAVIGSHDTGAGGMIGIDHGAHVLRIESGRQGSRAHQITDHRGGVAALGLVPPPRFGPRRKLRLCGRGSGKLGNRPEQSPAISKKHDAKLLLEILVREVLKDRKIDPVLGKPVRILGESKRSEPLSDRRHCATHPLSRGSLRLGASPSVALPPPHIGREQQIAAPAQGNELMPRHVEHGEFLPCMRYPARRLARALSLPHLLPAAKRPSKSLGQT